MVLILIVWKSLTGEINRLFSYPGVLTNIKIVAIIEVVMSADNNNNNSSPPLTPPIRESITNIDNNNNNDTSDVNQKQDKKIITKNMSLESNYQPSTPKQMNFTMNKDFTISRDVDDDNKYNDTNIVTNTNIVDIDDTSLPSLSPLPSPSTPETERFPGLSILWTSALRTVGGD